MFPRIDSPCPLKSIQFSQDGNFNCSMCKREVHNLSAMTQAERQTFLSQCSGEVCVSYKVKSGFDSLKKGAIAGLFVISATGLALPAAAGDNLNENVEDMVMIGGIKLPNQAPLDGSQDADSANTIDKLQLIPVVEENDESDSQSLHKK